MDRMEVALRIKTRCKRQEILLIKGNKAMMAAEETTMNLEKVWVILGLENSIRNEKVRMKDLQSCTNSSLRL